MTDLDILTLSDANGFVYLSSFKYPDMTCHVWLRTKIASAGKKTAGLVYSDRQFSVN